ncbi:MAG: hypothetical protein K2X99_09550 [Gemmatimonadaceae bacterium]|nr:hypothetical protein [Gemmatimonadaceae bacterium]
MDADGDLLTLEQQDRTRWDRALIAEGFSRLAQAASGDRMTVYHTEAMAASVHAASPSWAATDWDAIVRAYDVRLTLAPSPVVELNRIVALAQRDGAVPALAALDALEQRGVLQDSPQRHAVRGELLASAGDHVGARAAFDRAIAAVSATPIRRHWSRRRDALTR